LTSSMTLYHYWRSSCSWRVRWALAIKKIAYKSRPVDLLKNEHKQASYLQINPTGSLPCLVSQDRQLSESMAIIEWLDEQYPQPQLLPPNSWDRAKVREFCGIINGIQASQNLKILQRLSADSVHRQDWARYFIEQGFESIEKRLEQSAGVYCFGETLTMADLFLIPQVYNAKRFAVNMPAFPLTEGIYQRCLALTECDEAAPHNQPEASKAP